MSVPDKTIMGFAYAPSAHTACLYRAICKTKGRAIAHPFVLQIRPLARGYWRSLLLLDLRRRNDADSRKQGEAGGSVLKYVTDGDNAADDEDAHSGERKYATRRYRAFVD